MTKSSDRRDASLLRATDAFGFRPHHRLPQTGGVEDV